jgi:hypothetical protein
MDEATQGKALLCRYLCNEPQSRYGYLERHAPGREARLLERHQDMALCTSSQGILAFQQQKYSYVGHFLVQST